MINSHNMCIICVYSECPQLILQYYKESPFFFKRFSCFLQKNFLFSSKEFPVFFKRIFCFLQKNFLFSSKEFPVFFKSCQSLLNQGYIRHHLAPSEQKLDNIMDSNNGVAMFLAKKINMQAFHGAAQKSVYLFLQQS